jgi:hypothetical protein
LALKKLDVEGNGDFGASKDGKTYSEMHQPGIEPGASAWQAEILPLNH